jgi:putative ABC transport system permease protein
MQFNWLELTFQDLRFGIRTLARSPGFSLLAILSLALGIMATTAMYSVVHAVILDPFPYKDVDSLMSVQVRGPNEPYGRTWYSTDQFLEIAERSQIFEGVIASTISDVLWTGRGEPQRLRGNYVTTNTFDVMGVPPLVGRGVVPSDGAPGAAPIVVLGHRFWQRQFGGDFGVVGQQLRLNGTMRTIVGVMPQRFMWRGADVYIPIVFERGTVIEGVRQVHLLGRLEPGTTAPMAEQDLRPIIEDMQKREPGQFPPKWRVSLLSFKETFPSSIRETLWVLFGAVGLLLLIACVNVSNLLLSRAAGRHREMAMRSALGAGRGRLIRQLLTESVLLALAGGVLGTALAYGALRAIIALVPRNTIPDESVVEINATVLLFTVAVCLATAIVFGLAPAWQASKTNLVESLKDTGRSLGGGRRQTWLRGTLVVVEVALSVMLLVGASLMLRTLVAMQRADLGIRTERLLTVRVPLPESRYANAADRIAFFRELLDRLHSMPGIRESGLNSGLHPFGGWGVAVTVSGSTVQDDRSILLHQINPGYLKALGITLVAGRLFDEREVDARRQVAIVNQAFLWRYLNGQDGLGRTVRLRDADRPPFELASDSFEIVGVVRDTVNRNLRNEVQPELYVPYTVTARADRLAVLTHANPADSLAAIRNAVYAIDREQPLTNVETMDTLLDDFVFAGPRFSLTLFAVFAALGLTLAVVGVYGVIAHGVTRRTPEIGVRVALGATGAAIVRMVLAGGLKLMAVGLVFGLAASAAAARAMRELVWNISPWDPLSFLAVAAVLVLVGLQACLWPAVRATRIDPAIALRRE